MLMVGGRGSRGVDGWGEGVEGVLMVGGRGSRGVDGWGEGVEGVLMVGGRGSRGVDGWGEGVEGVLMVGGRGSRGVDGWGEGVEGVLISEVGGVGVDDWGCIRLRQYLGFLSKDPVVFRHKSISLVEHLSSHETPW